MGRSIRLTLAVADAEVADFISDPDTPSALAGALLAEVVTCSQSWHVGAPYPAEPAVAVGVVLLVRDHVAQVLLDGAPDRQVEALRRCAASGDWLFVGAELEPTLWPSAAVYLASLAEVRAAEASRDEWTRLVLPSPAVRFDLRVAALN